MLVKTRAGLADAVGKAVKDVHSYTTPSIMVVSVRALTPTITAGSSRRPPQICGRLASRRELARTAS